MGVGLPFGPDDDLVSLAETDPREHVKDHSLK